MSTFTKFAQSFAVLAAVSMTGCSTVSGLTDGLFGSDGEVKQYLKKPRDASVYDTSGFAFNEQEASTKALKQAQVTCGSKAVQVVSDNPRSLEYTENGEQSTVYVIDVTYRCGN